MSFIWGKMRTAAREAAPQITLRHCSKEVVSEKVKSLSRVRLCDPVDCSLSGSSVHGIFQARVLEWVAISFSKRGSRGRSNIRFW